MSSGRTLLITTSIVLAVAGVTSKASADDDPWFGADKGKHFGVSAALAAGGYGLGTIVFEDRWPCFVLGGGIALTAGVGKEIYDAMGYGHPSARDLVWDGVGTGVGLALAWAVDVMVRGNRDGKDTKDASVRVSGARVLVVF